MHVTYAFHPDTNSLLHSQVKARKEAARKEDVIDNVTEEQLQVIEDEFMKATEADVAHATAVEPATD